MVRYLDAKILRALNELISLNRVRAMVLSSKGATNSASEGKNTEKCFERFHNFSFFVD